MVPYGKIQTSLRMGGDNFVPEKVLLSHLAPTLRP